MKCDELKEVEYPIEWGLYYEKSEVDAAIAELKAKADKLHSCLKCLVMRDLIKDCPEKKSAIEIEKEYK